MKQVILTINSREQLAPDVYRMTLCGDVSAFTAPGQFLNIQLEGLFLRRPISVHDLTTDMAVIIFKAVGAGTRQLASLPIGTELNVLTGLGNGYDISASGDHPLLLGGGVGIPPLYLLCKKLIAAGRQVSVILGFNTAPEIFCEQDFRTLGADVTVTTVDGSYGVRGYVTDAIPNDYSYFYTCGPEPMLRSVYRMTRTSGQFSFEERMGCGFGACMGCTCETITGYKRICKDGPVLRKEEILWAD